MSYKDVRQFIEALSKTGDVLSIDQEVDWDLEIGAIGRRAYEKEGPAILFKKIKDYPGHVIFSGMLGTFRRVAISLGLSPDTPVKDIYAEYERRIKNPIKPKVVKDGPCKENKVLEKDHCCLTNI